MEPSPEETQGRKDAAAVTFLGRTNLILGLVGFGVTIAVLVVVFEFLQGRTLREIERGISDLIAYHEENVAQREQVQGLQEQNRNQVRELREAQEDLEEVLAILEREGIPVPSGVTGSGSTGGGGTSPTGPPGGNQGGSGGGGQGGGGPPEPPGNGNAEPPPPSPRPEPTCLGPLCLSIQPHRPVSGFSESPTLTPTALVAAVLLSGWGVVFYYHRSKRRW